MRPLFLAALLTATTLVGGVAAQTQPTVTPEVIPQGEAQARAALSECDRLATYLNEGGAPNSGLTPEQARAWQQANDATACRDSLEKLRQTAAAGSSGDGIKPVTSPGASGADGKPAEPAQTGALPADTQSITVDRLEEMALYNARDERLGKVDEVVAGPDNKFYLVIGHGGFLGLGEKKVILPVDQVALRGDRLIADTLSDDQVKAMPAFQDNDRAYKETDDGQLAPVRVLR